MDRREGDAAENLNIRSSRGASEYSLIFQTDLPCARVQFISEMGGLGAETLGTETFVVSVPVSVPPRLKMSGLVKVSVSRDFILKSRSRSRFHETQNESLGLGLGSMRPKLKVSVSVSFLRPGKLLVSPITAF